VERSFDGDPAGEQTDAGGAGKFFFVAFARGDIEDGSDPATVLGGDAAFVQFDPFYDLRVKGGEESEEVRRVIDGRVVKEDEILIGRAAADVETGAGFSDALDAGKGEHHTEHIGFSHNGRHLSDLLYAQLFDPQLDPVDI